MAMKMPVSRFVNESSQAGGYLPARAANALLIDCTTARHLLASALGRSRSEIDDNQLLDDLIEDSLVREVIVMEMEDFVGHEVDRARFCRARTVRDLAALLVE
jgi:acyl carrier protein